MTELKPIKVILIEEMGSRGLTPEKLSEITGVPAYYIRAILDSDFSTLPAAPYVRGYLREIATALRIDPEMLWEEYCKENELKQSGEKDQLPKNRFAQKPMDKKGFFIILLALIVLALLLPHIADFFGRPTLEITSPREDFTVTSQNIIRLEGRIANPQDKVLIDGSEIVVNENGEFSLEVPLDGKRTFEFRVKRFLGKETTLTRTVIFQPEDNALENFPSP